MVGNFKKGFNLIYHPRVHCPICKEEIFANALICPNCKTDFTHPPYNKRIEWQKTAMKIILVIAALIGISILFSGVPILLCIIIVFGIYGLGYFIVQRIQSIKNYFYK